MSIDYINPYLTLRPPAPEGSIMDPNLTPEEVQQQINKLKPRTPVPVAPGQPTPPGTPSGADLLVPLTSVTSRDRIEGGTSPSTRPAPTPRTVTPPAGATPPTGQETHVDPSTGQPIQDSRGSEFDEVQRRLKLLRSLQPDYYAEAQKYLGPAPTQGTPIDSRKLLLAALIPGIGGMITGAGGRGFRGSAAILEGAHLGQAQREITDQQALAEYRKNLGGLASQLGQQGEARIRDVQTGVHQERMDQAALERNRLLGVRYADQARIADEQIALRAFEWANPSANQQLQNRLGNMRLQETTLHNRIDEALGQGRLDQARAYQGQLLQMRQQEFGIKKQMLDVALARVQHADRNQVLQSVEGVQRIIDSITTELGTTALDPATQQELTRELQYYTGALHTLQQAASSVTGTAPTAGLTPPSQPSTGVPAGKGWQDQDGHIWKPDGKGGWTLVR